MSRSCYVAVSGGFDPLHVGHLSYLKAAKEMATSRRCKLMVILDSQQYLGKKGKGHPFYPTYVEREALVQAIRYVDVVVPQINDSTAESLEVYKPKIFAKGGDRASVADIPEEEVEVCSKYGIELVFGVGGYDKPQSSSWLIEKSSSRKTST
jgi:D-beta-D-heptose 7-phosphate kinase/D-beta-D-heptose 1-phosphate adenosyltransferase